MVTELPIVRDHMDKKVPTVRPEAEILEAIEEQQALETALAVENVQRHVGDKTIRKVVHIPDRLLNIVVG